MQVMQYSQDIMGHVPMDVQVRIAEGLGVTLSEVYGVATFYSQFALEPKGKYIIGVCLGTACYVRGSQAILDRICEELNLEPGKTSSDGLFTIEATRCIGACGLAPVITINDDVHGRLTADDVPNILKPYLRG
ncbi:MAG: NAD(P)H-dependent oxidoreductase subunit E [Christensenellaceae bacterium]|nr:NAD(P)H-dependent oxidoreductase subunit E [Christensenellaceae bacterium]